MFKNLFRKKDDKEKEKEKEREKDRAEKDKVEKEKAEKERAEKAAKARTSTADASPPPPAPSNSGERVTKEDFETLEVIGKGSFASVVLARHIRTGEYVAMKVVNKQGMIDHKRVRDVFTERNVLHRSNHPYLLRLHYTFQTEHKLFFVMDFMQGGDLDKYMNQQPSRCLDARTAQLYAAEVFLALCYLHEHRILYRDLKPENILLDREGHCVLADFGLSKDFEGLQAEMRADSFVGSPYYVSPDVLKQKAYDAAVDMWSLGILLYRMLCGRPPFGGKSMREVFDNILFSELRFPATPAISPEARDLIGRFLAKDATKRIKAEEVRAHPFWAGLDLKAVEKREIAPPLWRPLPPMAEWLEQRSAKPPTEPTAATPGAPTSSKTATVVNTPANASQLNPAQQTHFQGFSCTAESLLASK